MSTTSSALRRERDETENVDPHPKQTNKPPALSFTPSPCDEPEQPSAASPFQQQLSQHLHKISSEEELQSLMQRGDAVCGSGSGTGWECAEGKSSEWIALFVHAPWAWPNFCPRRGLLPNCASPGEPLLPGAAAAFSPALDTPSTRASPALPPPSSLADTPYTWPWIVHHSQVVMACVSVEDVPDAGAIVGIRAAGLPLLCMLRRTDNNNTGAGADSSTSGTAPGRGYRCVMSKVVKSGVEIASHTLLPPITTASELQSELFRNNKSTERGNAEATSRDKKPLLVGYIGASWCPPCCRVMCSLPALSDAFAAKGVRFVKMDYDMANELVTRQLGVEKIPTFVAFRASVVEKTVRKEELLPFGSLQNSDPRLVSDQVAKWCDLVSMSGQNGLTHDLFSAEDF